MATRRNPVPRFREKCWTNLRQLNALLYAASLGPAEDPEVYHDLHRTLRRVRSDAQLWARFAGARAQENLDRTDRRFRELSRMVGQVRDRSVGETLLLEVIRHAPARSAQRWHLIIARFRDESHIGQLLVAGRCRRILESGDVRTFLDQVGPCLRRSGSKFSKAATKEARKRARTLRRAVRRALRDPQPDKFHAARISLRRYRSLQSALDAAPRWPASLARLQVDLGRWHDLRLLRDRIDGAHPSPAVHQLLGALDRIEAPLARRVTRDLRRVQTAGDRLVPKSAI